METAFKSWELDNGVKLIDPTRDALYKHDVPADKSLRDARPWKDNPNHFRHVRISAVALLKMVMHARSGGSLEVMGLMQGYVTGDTFVVTDAFRLPVEGTETRVNAQADANEYLIEYNELSRAQGRTENVVGWYHSHPGYGCWLSGIDVETQAMQQQFLEPFLAVVIDPDRTINSGKVDIGAFRTYPIEYKSGGGGTDSSADRHNQAVPMAKIAEFGAHSSRYYSVEVSHFKSTLDTHLLELLWHKYWVQTLSANPLLTNREYGIKQLQDLCSRVDDSTGLVKSGNRGGGVGGGGGGVGGSSGHGGGGGGGAGGGSSAHSRLDKSLAKLSSDFNMIATNEKTGLIAGEVKLKVFGNQPAAPPHGGGS